MYSGKSIAEQRRHSLPIRQYPVKTEQEEDPDQRER